MMSIQMQSPASLLFHDRGNPRHDQVGRGQAQWLEWVVLSPEGWWFDSHSRHSKIGELTAGGVAYHGRGALEQGTVPPGAVNGYPLSP